MPCMIGSIVITARGSKACTMPISTPASDGTMLASPPSRPSARASAVKALCESSSIQA